MTSFDRRIARFVLTTIAALSACTKTPATTASPSLAMRNDPRIAEPLARMRAATNAYHDINAAVASGYPKTVADCITHENHGAMGFHHVNRAYLEKNIDVTRPQILLYERRPDGTYKLNGAEYFVRYSDWPRDSVPPVLFGQTMHHEDSFKYWYLHVWAWTDNRDGLFANFNPDVGCPGGGKVYKSNPDPPDPPGLSS